MTLSSDAITVRNGLNGSEARHEPQATILRELMDAALQEDLYGLSEHLETRRVAPFPRCDVLLPLRSDELYAWIWDHGSNSAIVFRARCGDPLQTHRFSRPPALALATGTARELSPAEVVSWLARTPGQVTPPGQGRLIKDLHLAEGQSQVAREAVPEIAGELGRPRPVLSTWERLAALRDRPFHPVARAKREWSVNDYRRYGAESGLCSLLHWFAIRRDHVARGTATGDPADWLLCSADRQALAAEFEVKGLASDDYLAMPAHAWQASNVLPHLFADEIDRGTVVPLSVPLGVVQPTASIRTVIPIASSGIHLKLPLAVSSLGALRPLPPRYLHNGAQAQHVLAELRARDPVLHESLRLCDETQWWCYARDEYDLLADRPGHLACNLRLYPGGEDRELIPMACFAVSMPDGSVPAFDYLLRRRGDSGPQAVLAVLEQLATLLCKLGLACFRAGVMPEVHGQNVLVELAGADIRTLILRDHDTLRIHEPWIEAVGLTPPDYRIDRSTPNTLILSEPEMLLAYFQTLGLQVNLRAIGHTLAEAYADISEVTVWSVIDRALRQAMAEVDLHGAPAAVVESSLFNASHWPHKLILSPLLRQTTTGTGMPSGLGRVPNPLRHLGGGAGA